jgi:hypothetical protein
VGDGGFNMKQSSTRKASLSVRKGRNLLEREKVAQIKRVASRKRGLSFVSRLGLRFGTFLFLAGLTTVVVSLGWRSFSNMDWLKIKNIEVNGLHHLNASDLLARTSIEVGSNWLTMGSASAVKALSAIPGIEKAEIRRRFPSTVVITISESEPIALAHDGGWLGLFENGSATDGEAWIKQDLPVLEGFAKLSPTRRTILCAFLGRTFREKPETFSRFSQVTPLSGGTAEVILRNGQAKVLLDPEAKSLNSLDFLETLLREKASSWRVEANIDLRVPDHAYVL